MLSCSTNSDSNIKLLAIFVCFGALQLEQILAKPITKTLDNNAVEELPQYIVTSDATNLLAAEAPVKVDNNVAGARKTRHIIGGFGGGFGGFGDSYSSGFSSPIHSAPIYTSPIVTSVPIVSSIPVVSSYSTIQTIPSYTTGFGYGGSSGLIGGGLIGSGLISGGELIGGTGGGFGFGKFHQSYHAKGFGFGGGYW